MPDNISDFLYTTSNNGWTSNDIGLRWLDEVFLPETENNGETRLLLMDGHGSHTSTQFMWKCYENNVLLVYLIPHSSHVLQPLDLACFSPLKSRYRKQLTELAKFDDSAPVKKMQFLLHYNKARNEGLSPLNMKAGWKAAGIHPWNPPRAIRSSQVTRMTSDTPQALEAPETPLRRKRKASPNVDINTPHNRRQLQANLDLISQSYPIPRAARILFQKTGKGFDVLHARGAQDGLKISRQSARLQQLEQKKKKKALSTRISSLPTLRR
jgi:DDE superfamily endonuclease